MLLAYFHSGRYYENLSFFDKALEINPEYIAAYNNKGTLFFHMGRYEEAINEYDKKLIVDSQFIASLLGKAFSLLRLQGREEAKELVKKAFYLDICSCITVG